MHLTSEQSQELLLRVFRAALVAADPRRVLPAFLPEPPAGRTLVVGAGKAAAAMAAAVEAHWPAERLSGVVAVPEGASLPLRHIEQITASHPVPDDRSVVAAAALMRTVQGLGPQDMVLALLSGGGSALCALPAQGVTLAEKQGITRALLRSGASIAQINTVRKHLSAIKGGRLAAEAFPARVVSLLLSDIPGDDPGLIASGPTLPDPSTCAQALDILDHYAFAIGDPLRHALAGGELESPKPGDACFVSNSHRIIASAQTGLQAAAECARSLGVTTHILADAMQGEARDLALAHAAIALQVQRYGQPFAPPCLLLSGGETTVTVKGTGRGGRNTEFALALALALQANPGIFALSAGTDGLDGSSEAAGAWIGPLSLVLGTSVGHDAHADLRNNDSFSYFDAIGATVITGPTYTNINDLRAVLVQAAD
jgi:hydroxypyruvate reductase